MHEDFQHKEGKVRLECRQFSPLWHQLNISFSEYANLTSMTQGTSRTNICFYAQTFIYWGKLHILCEWSTGCTFRAEPSHCCTIYGKKITDIKCNLCCFQFHFMLLSISYCVAIHYNVCYSLLQSELLWKAWVPLFQSQK